MSKLLTTSVHIVTQGETFSVSPPLGWQSQDTLFAHVSGNGKTIIVPLDGSRAFLSSNDIRALLSAQRGVIHVSIHTGDTY